MSLNTQAQIYHNLYPISNKDNAYFSLYRQKREDKLIILGFAKNFKNYTDDSLLYNVRARFDTILFYAYFLLGRQ